MYMTSRPQYSIPTVVDDHLDDARQWIHIWEQPRLRSTLYGSDGLRTHTLPLNWMFLPCT